MGVDYTEALAPGRPSRCRREKQNKDADAPIQRALKQPAGLPPGSTRRRRAGPLTPTPQPRQLRRCVQTAAAPACTLQAARTICGSEEPRHNHMSRHAHACCPCKGEKRAMVCLPLLTNPAANPRWSPHLQAARITTSLSPRRVPATNAHTAARRAHLTPPSSMRRSGLVCSSSIWNTLGLRVFRGGVHCWRS